MKGTKHPSNDLTINPSQNESILDVVSRVEPARRRFIKGAAGSTMLAAAGGVTLSGIVNTVNAAPIPPSASVPVGIGFESIPAETAPVVDAVIVPSGYKAELLVAWGDPITAAGAPYLANASQDAEAQEEQYGMHTDGMHFFPFTSRGKPVSDRGVLCANNEYTHEEILHVGGLTGGGYTIAKCRKSQAAHGVALLEVRKQSGKWKVVKDSPFGRRLTANTPMILSGPAAGHPLMQVVDYDITPTGSVPNGTTDGHKVYGTQNNCANGITPWGTYLTCEENWNGYFGSTSGVVPAPTSGATGKSYNRYGITAAGFGYLWHTVDERFDVSKNPNEPNLFGWVVEVDPFDPNAVAVKRTALGRFKHESAQYVVDAGNDVAFYMGDDERNEYVYKFVCAGKFNPANRGANMNLLDSGTLYVARFNSNLTGEWIALEPGTVGLNGQALRDNANFAGGDDADVLAKILINARMAADAVGATMMDRPEWTAARPRLGDFGKIEVYCTLTNNNRRGSSVTPSNNLADGSTAAGSARPAVDAANPRANNLYGHIIRWTEDGDSVRAATFTWDLFVQCGDSVTTKLPKAQYEGNMVDSPAGSADIGAPDGLWFDWFGRLWVQTDQAGDGLGDWINIGTNSLSCADPVSKEFRRFMTGPNKSEVTGITMTPDGKTLFVGIQHPGEDSTAANPTQHSNWPASQWSVASDGVTPLPGGRPRSGVVVITKNDGGIIGA